ncbi:MAG: ATP cone domain-containing protein, partial [Burkholderiaceae bacterium]
MQWASQPSSTPSVGSSSPSPAVPASAGSSTSAPIANGPHDFKVVRRNGAVVSFDAPKINVALTKAFLAVQGGQGAASARVREMTESLTQQVVDALLRRMPAGGTVHIEDIQDQVELALMRSGEHEVARAYVLYRERRSQERAAQTQAQISEHRLNMSVDGRMVPLDESWLRDIVASACAGLDQHVRAEEVLADTVKNLYDGVPVEEVEKSAILAARALIEKDPAYAKVSARLLLHTVRKEIFQAEV